MSRKAWLILVFLFLLFLPGTRVYAVTMDNDGAVRDNPYGDSGLPSSYTSGEYYDCYLPYNVTIQEIGGYAVTATNSISDTYRPMPEYVYEWPAGVRTNYQGDGSSSKYISTCVMSHEEETGMQVYTDANGNQYYGSAIQHFFYNNSTVGSNGFPGWSIENRGQAFDVILTDGTVIPFLVLDANAIQHTNAGSDDPDGSFDVEFGFSALNYPQYAHLFAAMAGNCLELWGRSGCANRFNNKYNIGKDEGENRIAYYRMYNLDVDDGLVRSAKAGTSVSYSLGSVTIDASSGTSNNSSGAVDSLGNAIVPESGLVGMNGLGLSLAGGQGAITYADRDGLSVGEQYSVVSIGEDIALNNRILSIDRARVAIVFVGLILVFYGVLLILCMMLDRVNGFIDISFVGLITLGFIKYNYDEKELGRTSGYVSTSKLVCLIAVIFICGCLLVSGGVLPFMMRIVEYARSFF